MDQSNRQSTPQAQTSGERDMMYCHECRDEWFRDEHGLTCPECGSDFTEIIEPDHDPRGDEMGGHDDDDDSLPSLEDAHPHLHPLAHHNPWRDAPDPDEDDISNLQFRQTGPGTFAVTGTIYRTVPRGGTPGGGGGPQTVQNPLMNSFASMLNTIVGGGRRNPQQQGQDESPSEPRSPSPGSRTGSGTTPGGHRFMYSSSARLFPRDSDHPGPRLEPVDELNNVLVGLMAALGQPPGHHPPGQAEPNMPGHNHPFHPLAALFSGMMPGNGQAGDFVYSQEALDRIISQLMEQNATGNAPGPASQDDINSLPKKPVTEDMLGPEGKAECSICMDEVKMGELVTELPCRHWFHQQCVAMWLGEHDTCPHCRKGITKQSEDANASGGPGADASTSANASNARGMPGSFGVAGESTGAQPFGVPGSPEQRRDQGNSDNQASQRNSEDGGSLGERLRRGLFGAPR